MKWIPTEFFCPQHVSARVTSKITLAAWDIKLFVKQSQKILLEHLLAREFDEYSDHLQELE